MAARLHRLVAAISFIAGCNALLDNEPGSLDVPTGGRSSGGASTGDAGDANSGGAAAPATGGAEAPGANAGAAGADSEAPADGGASSGGATAEAGASSGGVTPTAGSSSSGGTSPSSGGGGSDGCECVPREIEQREQACGPCNRGTQTVTRTCTTACQWSDWGVPTACSPVTVECEPGATKMLQAVCGGCGKKTQIQTCSSSCAWGTPVDSGTCAAFDCDDCAHVEWCTDPDTGGTTCVQDACTEAQALADCNQDIEDLSCVKKQPFTMK
jgi:hypothetical protein